MTVSASRCSLLRLEQTHPVSGFSLLAFESLEEDMWKQVARLGSTEWAWRQLGLMAKTKKIRIQYGL